MYHLTSFNLCLPYHSLLVKRGFLLVGRMVDGAAVAHGLSDNLITRAADVMLKERRRLILMVRETPLNLVHLRNMTTVTEMGGIIFPPVPAFYHRPQSITDLVDHSVERVLDLLGMPPANAARWPVDQ